MEGQGKIILEVEESPNGESRRIGEVYNNAHPKLCLLLL